MLGFEVGKWISSSCLPTSNFARN